MKHIKVIKDYYVWSEDTESNSILSLKKDKIYEVVTHRTPDIVYVIDERHKRQLVIMKHDAIWQ